MSHLAITDAEQQRIDHIDRSLALGSDGIGDLIAALEDPSWTVRRAAVSALAATGDAAVRVLVDWLVERRTSEHAIAAAVDALVASTGASTNQAVAQLLANPRPAVAADAAVILGRRRAQGMTSVLAALLDHADDNVAVAAIEALDASGAVPAIDALAALLAKRHFFRTFPALQVLANTGDPRAIAPIAQLLDDPAFRDEAARALGRTGLPQAIRPLAALLERAPDGATTRLVAVALAGLLSRASWAGAEVVAAALHEQFPAGVSLRLQRELPSANAEERAALVVLLGHVGDATAITAVAQCLAEPALRAVSTSALRRLGDRYPEGVPAALEEGDYQTRLALLPIVSRAASSLVRALLDDDDPEIRARACEAIARIGDTTVLPKLFEMLGDANARASHAAVAAINSLGSSSTPRMVIDALRSRNPVVQRQALRVVGYLGYREAFEAIHDLIDVPDRRIAELAVVALAMLDHVGVDDVIARIARGNDDKLRAAAMRAAAHRATPPMASLLESGITDDSSWVRYYACQGLGRIGRVSAVALVIGRLADATPHVRVAAIEALAHLDSPMAWQALTSISKSSDPDERRAALLGIGLHGRSAALPYLLDAAADADVATRLVALAGLARSAEPPALDALIAAGRSDKPTQEAALSLLADREDDAAAAALVTLALSVAIDHPVARALSRPTPARVAAIAAALAHADDRGASILAAALARMSTPAANQALVEALSLPRPAVRRAVATVLAATPSARASITRLANEDPDPEVRRLCAAVLAS